MQPMMDSSHKIIDLFSLQEGETPPISPSFSFWDCYRFTGVSSTRNQVCSSCKRSAWLIPFGEQGVLKCGSSFDASFVFPAPRFETKTLVLFWWVVGNVGCDRTKDDDTRLVRGVASDGWNGMQRDRPEVHGEPLQLVDDNRCR